MANRQLSENNTTESSVLLTADMVAKLLMLNVSRVHQMGREGIIPREDGGKYRLVSAVQGYIKFLKKDNTDEDLISLSKEKARLTKAQREKAELELSLAKRDAISIDEFSFEIANILKTLLAKLDPLPDYLERSAQLTPDQINVVERIIREVRTELYEKLTTLPGYEEPDK